MQEIFDMVLINNSENKMQRPFDDIYQETLLHLRQHDCGTYPFGDGNGLIDLVSKLAPDRILELGTALGYTACCFAKAASAALIDTVEMDSAHVQLARENIARHGFKNRVTVYEGKFEETMPRLYNAYDLVFFDGFAPNLDILIKLQERLRTGGYLICANLGLADAPARNQLEREILNSPHWKIQPALENGGTRVAVKCVA